MTTVTPWTGEAPTEEEIGERFRAEGLTPSRWSNSPGDRYSAHAHGYHKVLYCVSGGIVFHVDGQDFQLSPGERLDLPPGTPHSATVGPEGVVCMEAAAYS